MRPWRAILWKIMWVQLSNHNPDPSDRVCQTTGIQLVLDIIFWLLKEFQWHCNNFRIPYLLYAYSYKVSHQHWQLTRWILFLEIMQKTLRKCMGASRFWLLITNNTSTIICFPTHCCCWIFLWPCYSFLSVSAVFYKLWKIRRTWVIGRRQCSITWECLFKSEGLCEW